MVFTLPQTMGQAIVMLVPFLTLVIGMLYLAVPKRILHASGVVAEESKPHAIGEGRSSYAGILIACGAGCLFLQEPLALQPGLNLLLALAWLITGFGLLLQIGFDQGRELSLILKMCFAFILGAIAYWNAELVNFNFALPQGSLVEWMIFLVALLTLVLGLISLFIPRLALKILKLRPSVEKPYGQGQTRGILAGFYIALGAACLFYSDPFIAKQFAAIIMAGAWLLTGFGRFVSIIMDRGATLYNFAAMVFEAGIGGLLLALMLGLL